MLLNTWLSAAKTLFSTPNLGASGRRAFAARTASASEALEERSLLTALVINDGNLDSFVNADGGLTINTLGTHDSLVIEQISLSAIDEAISINLSNVALERLAIETVDVTAYTGTAIDINLTNVTGNRTISLEDITIASGGAGININLDDTDSHAVTIEDSIVPSISIAAINGSDIVHGLVTENEVIAPANLEAVALTVTSNPTNTDTSSADNFHVVNNRQLQALNRDALQINLTDAPLDGLKIANNEIGNEPGADVLFRANGDTFVQPFELTNNGLDGEQLLQFTMDLEPLGLVFDVGSDGQPFTVTAGSDVTAAEASSRLTNNNQTLIVDFTDFTPGETLLFVIDVDIAPAVPGDAPISAPIFGNDLIGTPVQFNFDAGNSGGQAKSVAGVMVGDADVFNASVFARGAGAAADVHGINLNLAGSPLTNAEVFNNVVTGVAGHGILVDAVRESDVSAIIKDNSVSSSGQDGIHFDLEDSNFVGAVNANSLNANSGYGLNFQPSVSRSGVVEEAFDGDPIVITSTNHRLETGDVIIIQGMTNADPSINHPGNGVRTVTRLSNDTFSIDANGLVAGVNYNAGGAWYVPDFVAGEPQGLVSIDVKATEAEGRVTAIQNPAGGGDVEITSPAHGLTSGERIRLTGATGTLLAGDFKITVLDANTFALDGQNAIGAYDTSEGLAVWRAQIITGATNPTTGDIEITSLGHGLRTGDEVRVANVGGNTAANGTFTITRLSADVFALQGSTGNGIYSPNTGYWTPISESTFTGDSLPQQISGNAITNNGVAGIYVNLLTGTRFDGDLLNNVIVSNAAKGIHIESHSYGVGETLPLDPADPLAIPGAQDISFDVNIGSDVQTTSPETGIPLDGNFINQNGDAGIVVEVLDQSTGSFEIQGNRIVNNRDDNDTSTNWAGDGIYVTLESDVFPVDSTALLVESVIENNTIGVDAQGNEGNGLSFNLTERARIQDLEVTKNFFGNNALDGFHFVRTENGSLNSVVFEDNDVTNNGGDGFDLYAENSVDDRLDFKIRRNDINNNAEYGLRVDVQAAARVEIDFETNDVFGNGHSAGGNGFHPTDGTGNSGAAGGVGIFAFEEVEVVFNADNSKISQNFGDGFSVDAFDERDTLRLTASFTDVEFVGNTLTGARIQGAAFATVDFTSSLFNENREDGVRMITTLDQNSPFQTRVGGSDIDVTAIGNQFVGNWGNGAVLGQGVSAVFGTGNTTSEFANIFDRNGFTDPQITGQSQVNTGGDGLKIVQNVGPYLHNLGRRRVIETDANFFRNNGGDGIDIGHDVNLEGGNVEHGYEVASDVDVIVNNAIISNNGGDGVEYLADPTLRVAPIAGSGQVISAPTDISSLQISNSRIESNALRGVDILNRVGEDSRITLFNNEILTNTLSGVYVVNSSSHFQTQAGPNDILVASTFESGLTTPNIELRVQENNILDNGNQQSTSTVPIPLSEDPGDTTGQRNSDWTHNYRQVTGTLGGLVLRVGTADSVGIIDVAQTDLELGQSGIDAEVFDNTFNGNFGSSVFLDSFVSVLPPQTQGRFDDDVTGGGFPGPTWNQGYRDPLSRLDLVFRENSGNSLDVTNGFAFIDNHEDYFKSRHPTRITNPPTQTTHTLLNPGGFFPDPTRARNATRTLGWFDTVGSTPSAAYGNRFSFEGHGTPTWRVESDFDFDQFGQTSTVQGFSTFLDTVDLLNSASVGGDLVDPRFSYQWDTGRNTANFTGLTPFSLTRGDVFNVQPGEDPIEPDGLEENDSFLGATELGVIAGNGFSVNSLTTGSSQPGILNIERKGDRDYYRFRTAEQFLNAGAQFIAVNLGVNDALGSDVQFMIYEIVPGVDTEEQPLIELSGIPQYFTTAAGSTNSLQVAAKPNTEYVIEVLSDERTNFYDFLEDTWFYYGTTRSYSLSVDAPAGTPPNQASSDSASRDVVTATAPGTIARVNLPGEDPFVLDITDIGPGTINTAVDAITVTFSEDVTGVDIEDFILTRNGVAMDLTGATLTPQSFEVFEISGLAGLTAESGDYLFSVDIANSGIVDTDATALQAGGDDSEAWSVDTGVTTVLDTVDNIPGDGLVADANGNRSLRAAINEANANPGADVIELPVGTYTLTIDGRFEDEGLQGDLDILESVTIRGLGANASATIIDADTIDRIFHVLPGVELTLENLTLRRGEAFDGGGILVEGFSTFAGATALSAGSVNLTDVNVRNNEAYNQGGGIYNLGTVNATQSSISLNTAGSRGGGIFNHGDVFLENATVSSNSAVSRGGGIYNELLSSQVNPILNPVRNVGAVSAINSTIASNTAGAKGGGVYQETGGTLRIGNSIITENVALGSPDIDKAITSLGYNFIGIVGGPEADLLLDSTDTAADITEGVTVAGLSGLTAGDNGTLLHKPVAGAFVVDAGSNDLYESETSQTISEVLADTDQGGSPRLVEGDDDGQFAIDIGASEYFISKPVAIIAATPNPAGENELVSLDGTASTHTLQPGDSLIATYQWDFNYDGITFVQSATGPNASVSYSGTGVNTVALLVTDTNGQTDLQTIDITVDVPAPPVVTGPFSAGTSDLTPTITWDAGAGIFDLEVTNVATEAVVISEEDLTTFSYTPTSNLAPGTYQVVVTATNASGTETSQPYQFTVLPMQIFDPANFDVEFDITPEIQFSAIPNAARYQVWVTQLDPNDRTKALSVVINDSLVNAGAANIPGTDRAIYEPFTELTEGFYRVWVRAIEADGNFGEWSSGHQFTIARPSVIAPAFVTRVTLDSTPVIRWSSVGANQYQLWVTQMDGTDVNGNALASSQIVINTIVTGGVTEYEVPFTLGNGRFRVWVRGVDDDGEAGLWSFSYDFTKDLTTGPNPISPIGGVTTTDRTPVFEWQAVSGATHYELWVNNSSRQIPRIIHDTEIPHVDGVTTITYTDPSVVLRNATYAWWVRAFNEDGEATAWTSRQTFFVPAPVMTSPIGQVNGTNLPTFNWTGVDEYVRYELWVNNESTGQSRVLHEVSLPGTPTTFTPTLPLENGDFRAWIRGFDADGNDSQWSNPVLFTIDSTVTDAPRAIDEFSFANNDTTFIWEPTAQAQSYEILVKNLLQTGQPTALNEIAVGTPFGGIGLSYQTSTLLVSGSYRWWIRGLNADGNAGPWSQPRDFTVASNDLESLPEESPVMLASFEASTPLAEWTDDLHSITVHPAAVVEAVLTQDATSSASIEADVVPVEAAAEVDEVMAAFAVSEELDLTTWAFDEVLDAADVATEQVISDAVEASPANSGTGTSTAAAALAFGIIPRRRRSRRNRDE